MTVYFVFMCGDRFWEEMRATHWEFMSHDYSLGDLFLPLFMVTWWRIVFQDARQAFWWRIECSDILWTDSKRTCVILARFWCTIHSCVVCLCVVDLHSSCAQNLCNHISLLDYHHDVSCWLVATSLTASCAILWQVFLGIYLFLSYGCCSADKSFKILEILKNIDNVLCTMAVGKLLPDVISARARLLRERDKKKKRRKRKRLAR